MQVADNVHVFIEAITALMVFGGFVTTLLIKNNQATVKEELIEKQTEIKDELVESQNTMREDMDRKHAENSRNIAVHSAADDVKFGSISQALTRIDNKLDKLSG